MLAASGLTRQWFAECIAGVAAHPDRRLFLVAEVDGQVVGYARASRFDPDPEDPPNMVPAGYLLVGIQVLPEARRRGVGRALTAARLDWIDARGGPTWYWADDDNLASIELHRGFGFTPHTTDFVFKVPPRNDAPRTLYRRGPT